MESDICIGIASKGSDIRLAALGVEQDCIELTFPSTPIGVKAIKIALADYEEPIRLAIAGADALPLALALGSEAQGEIFIVAPGIADRPIDLARFARRTS